MKNDQAKVETLLDEGGEFSGDDVWVYYEDDEDIPTAADDWVSWLTKAEVVVAALTGPDSPESRMVTDAREIDVVNTHVENFVRARELVSAALRSTLRQIVPQFSTAAGNAGLQILLHPVIRDKALPQLRAGHLRDAVLNSLIAVFDLLRAKTHLDLDGA